MIHDRHQSARMQSDFYRDRYYFLLKMLLLSLSALVFLCVTIIWLALTRKPIQYYAATTEGQIIMLTPVVASNK